jgi:hypothetical protein
MRLEQVFDHGRNFFSNNRVQSCKIEIIHSEAL